VSTDLLGASEAYFRFKVWASEVAAMVEGSEPRLAHPIGTMNSFSNKFTRQLSSTANKIREKFVFSSSTKGVLEQPTMIVGHEEVPLVGQHGMVHLEYDIANPPARPERPHSRFVLISDTHNANFDLPDGDVLLHSGDLTNKGTVSDFRLTMDWISNAPHPIKMSVSSLVVQVSELNSRIESSEATMILVSIRKTAGTISIILDGTGKASK
jgi:hypothetical protein